MSYIIIRDGMERARRMNESGGIAPLSSRTKKLLALAMILWVGTFGIFTYANMCTDSAKATVAASAAGYSDAKIVQKTAWFTPFRGCGLTGLKRFKMTGTKDGVLQTFYVCASPFQDGTVR